MSSNNSTREIPISDSLENLLTDVEFEYSDVTLEESTTSTVPVKSTTLAESNFTADTETVKRNASIETTSTEEPRGLPDHEFIRKTINGKKGKMKGVARTAQWGK